MFSSPAECVGAYLDMAFKSEEFSLSSGEISHFYHSSAVVHECHNYNSEQLIKYLFMLYERIPESYEILNCTSHTTKDDIKLFFQRIEYFPRHYSLLKVDELSSSLQEV